MAPVALFFCAMRKQSLRRYRPWLWILLLLVPALRIILWINGTGHFFVHNPDLFSPLYYSSFTHCDGLIMGLIIANLWVTREKIASRFAAPGILVALAVILLFALHLLQKEIFDFTILALLFGSFVWYGLQRRPAIFNSRIFYWLSRLSFGMYLNHEYMCPWVVNTVLPKLPFTAHLPVFANCLGVLIVVLLSALISLVTFCCVEHPFLQIRKVVLSRPAQAA
jgi:peptidoglycan/LPS O-acetylase OafA/YrhL